MSWTKVDEAREASQKNNAEAMDALTLLDPVPLMPEEVVKEKPKKKAKLSSSSHDPVNSPQHYTSGGIETIDYMQAKLTPEEFIGYLKGNVIKYTSRAGKKIDMVEDYAKAQWYINKLVATLKGEK